jgi:hypothetical protein
MALIFSYFQTFAVTFEVNKPGRSIKQDQVAGTCLPVWNSEDIYNRIKPGLIQSNYKIFRYPNGSVSNEFHWNGTGIYDSNGIWWPDSIAFTPGFRCHLKHQGTSSENFGTESYSRVTDGDTTTFWWSDPAVTETNSYCFLYFPSAVNVDSMVIYWGKEYSTQFDIQYWDGPIYYHTQQYDSRTTNFWKTLKSVNDGTGGITRTAIPSTPVRKIRIVSKQNHGQGFQICETFLYNKGTLVSKHSKSYSAQTQVVAVTTHTGSIKGDTQSWDFETFLTYIRSIDANAIPVITVNYGSGTPEEAARWVHYSNIVKKHKIKYWQIGNEMDGEWEFGGPMNAYAYAEKFIKFSKVMKATDPTICIFGPVVSGDYTKPSGEYDNRAWLEAFLFKVNEAEKRDNFKYLDAVDIHLYPYYYGNKIPNPDTMMTKADQLNKDADTLKKWINLYCKDPDSIYVMMSEYNSSSNNWTVLTHRPINAIFNANMNASLTNAFGDRAMSIIWDSFENGLTGTDNTHGNVSLFDALSGSARGNWYYAPSALFWGNYLVINKWLSSSNDNSLVTNTGFREGALRYYGNKTKDDFRVLVLNMSTTESLSPSIIIQGESYSDIDIYEWSEREYTWNGTSSTAFAFPNCGPSSVRMAYANHTLPKLPPLSALVVRYFKNGSSQANAVPERIFTFINKAEILRSDTLKISSSYICETGIISSLAYSIDGGTYTDVTSIDGKCDGPSENIKLLLPAKIFSAGKHQLSIKATSGTSFFIDTVSFNVKEAIVTLGVIDDFNDKNMDNSLWGTSWNSVSPASPAGSSSQLVIKSDKDTNYLHAQFSSKQNTRYTTDNTFFYTSVPASFFKNNPNLIKGLNFVYRTTTTVNTLSFYIGVTCRINGESYNYKAILPFSSIWKNYVMTFNEFNAELRQGQSLIPLPADSIESIRFSLNGIGDGTFSLNNINLTGNFGGVIPVNQTASHPRISKQLECVSLNSKYIQIHYRLSGENASNISIFNLKGALVQSFNFDRTSGTVTLIWNRENRSGIRTKSGAYVIVAKEDNVNRATTDLIHLK